MHCMLKGPMKERCHYTLEENTGVCKPNTCMGQLCNFPCSYNMVYIL